MSRLAAAAAFALVVCAPGAAPARSRADEGRAHLKRANALAGNDRCQAAIKEYTLAFDKLGDPVVLFNRAECFRRIGEDARAAADYRAFLAAVPNAPNRAQIESKLAALDAPGAARPAVIVRAKPAAAAPVAAAAVPLPPADVAAAATVSSAPAASDEPAPLAIDRAAAPAPQAASAHGRWWLWAAIGGAVAAGAAAALLLRPSQPSPPMTSLGNFRF